MTRHDSAQTTVRDSATEREKPVKRKSTKGKPAKRTSARATEKKGQQSLEDEVKSALTWLERHSSKQTRDGMARYGIPSDKALGVSVADIRLLAKRLGRSHELAAALWKTGVYEARMLTSFVDEPERVTPAQMDRWCRDFDSWAICDTLCFHLFDRTPHAWQRSRSGATSAGNSSSARPSRYWRVSPCTTSAPPTRRLRKACASSSAPPPTNGTSSRKASAGRCAPSANEIPRSTQPR
jgi:hypothetical protein